MMKPFIVVGYYTDKYKDDAVEFTKSCAAFNVPVHCQYVSDQGDWVKNCSYKPTFILDCLNKFTQDVVYVDVDARIESFPELFNNIDCDISFYNGQVWEHSREPEVLSGTIYFKNCEKVKKVVEKWKKLCDNNNREMDQVFLASAISNDCVVKKLPVEYCAIFDSPMIDGKDVVIRHLQHSRQRRHDR